jgi:hypothetical protein
MPPTGIVAGRASTHTWRPANHCERPTDSALATVRVPGGNFTLQACGQILLMGPRLRPGPLGQGQELGELAVEVGRAAEAAAGQERALQIIVEAFHQAFGLRVARLADDHPDALGAAEPLTVGGQLGAPSPLAADRTLTVSRRTPSAPCRAGRSAATSRRANPEPTGPPLQPQGSLRARCATASLRFTRK